MEPPEPDSLLADLATLRDQLARVEQENASLRRRLAESEARLAPRVQQLPQVAVQWYDSAGHVLLWNRGSETLFGWPSDQVCGKSLGQLILTPEETASFSELLDRVRQTGESVGPVELAFRRQDGSTGVCLSTLFPISAPEETRAPEGGEQEVGRPVCACLGVDITERKKAEDSLRLASAFFARALEAARAGAWERDLGTGAGVWSPECAAVLGLERGAALTPEVWSASIHPEDRDQAVTQAREAAEARHDLDQTYRIVWPDGSVRWVRDVGRVREWPAGSTGKLHGLMIDVTAQRQAEEERRALDQKLHEDRALESLGVLAGGIAHDFNNILTTVLGYASLTAEALPETSVVQSYLAQIEQAGRRAAGLCEQMVAYAGRGYFLVQPVDLTAVVRETLESFRGSTPRGIQLMFRSAPDLPLVQADPAQMQQVALALLTNAVEAVVSREGLVTVSTQRVQLGRAQLDRLRLGEGLAEGAFVCLEVADNGAGMDAPTLARIFEPFFSTKFTGRGLGLSAVLGIVRSHKGAVEVHSQPGVGTTVRIYLPAAPVPFPEGKAPSVLTGVRGEGVVLVAEDEDSVLQLVVRLLGLMGFRVLEARDGVEAVELFRQHSAEVRLVLLDLTMPRLGGGSALQQIRALNPGVPVILMSGYSVKEISPRYAGEGAIGFLQKPFGLSELAEQVVRLRPREGQEGGM